MDSTHPTLPFTTRLAARPAAIAVAVVVGGLAALSLALWAYYGSAVFHEMIVAGLALCF